MSGWTKVFLATGLMVLAIGWFNFALWRRLRLLRQWREQQDAAEAAEPLSGPVASGTEPGPDRSPER